jgi:hypothetical protein
MAGTGYPIEILNNLDNHAIFALVSKLCVGKFQVQGSKFKVRGMPIRDFL